jgi:CubicO group peptidase (beta-lactamase class C family)
VTVDSVFQIGSITKVLTATLIMQLVDEGLLDLDAPIRTYLSDFAVADGRASEVVTIRHFLCHTSGIEGDLFVDSGRGVDTVARLQDMGRLLPQLFPPGERMSYCNFGFAMLGRVIEVITGLTYDAAIRKRLFEPLRMRHALTLPEDTLRFRCAIGHVPDPRHPAENRITPIPWLSQGQKAAGATPSMAVGDLLKFVALHLDKGRNRDGEQLLSTASVRAMQRPQIKLPRHAPRGVTDWGLGWFLGRWSSQRVIGHDGGTIGQYAFLRVLPHAGLAVALFTNGGDAVGLYDEIFGATFARRARVRMPVLPEPQPGLRADPGRIVGCYENLSSRMIVQSLETGIQLSVERRGGTIAGVDLPATPVQFVDRNAVRAVTGDAVLDRTVVTFEGGDAARPAYASLGSRLFRRI